MYNIRKQTRMKKKSLNKELYGHKLPHDHLYCPKICKK